MKDKPESAPLPGRINDQTVLDVTVGEAIFAALWVFGFIAARHFLTSWLDSMSPYALYGLDLFYSLLSIHFFSNGRFRLTFPATKLHFAEVSLALLLGLTTYKIAEWQSILIPFDFESPYTLIALLGIAPILEELLFRQAVWFSLETLSARWGRVRAWFPWIATSVLFALAHFEAYLTALPEFHSFILYQTLYAFAISLWFGRAYLRTGSVGLTMGLHFAFNSGFYLGTIV